MTRDLLSGAKSYAAPRDASKLSNICIFSSSLTLLATALAIALLLTTPGRAFQTESLRDLNSHCPFHPPESLEVWQQRAEELRLQLQVATGLYPLPLLEPVEPQIYGKVERDGYTIEKCIFESLPGFYVTGNLYRPAGDDSGQRRPGVLCPHGHWNDARFMEASEGQIRQALASGAERFRTAATNPIQARCVQLARMGCVVFHWDMIGYCDSQQIDERAHRFADQPKEDEVTDNGWLLFSPLAESHGQSVLGLQTLATRRAVEMLQSLEDVDPSRIAITGASGGGTQSFIGAALDERIQVAFPAVMVSTGMQGGCTCENASLLRIGTGNVEMAGLIAPRPLGLTAADDWTRTMPEDGFPELQQLYELFDARSRVALFPAVHFGHNFNHVSRVALYGWINQHFNLGFETPILESDFELANESELSVWDDGHPEPEGGLDFERRLMKRWSELVEARLERLQQGDAQQQREASELLTNGWRVCLGLTTRFNPDEGEDANSLRLEQIDAPEEADDDRLLIVVADTTGGSASEKVWRVAQLPDEPQALVDNPRLAAAYTYGYNLPVFAKQSQRLAHRLLKILRDHPQAQITLKANRRPAALAAAAIFCARQLAPELNFDRLHGELQPGDFRFADVDSIRDPYFLPGSARYGDVGRLIELLEQSE